MKLIIAGSRTLNPSVRDIGEYVSKYNIHIREVVSGGAKGVDTSAEKYALAADQPEEPKFTPPIDDFKEVK